MKLSRNIAIASIAIAVCANQSHAQMITFATAGSFSGAGCTSVGGVALTSAWCDVAGGSRLTYNYGTQQILNQFGNAQFGSFQTSGLGASTFANVFFSLAVTQTFPTAGGSTITTGVVGTISAQQGGLVWGPIDPTTFSIGAVDYTIARDLLSGGVRIDPPGAGGVMGDPQTIRGFVTTVPEPSTYVLMAAGLAAVGLVSRRRRSAQA